MEDILASIKRIIADDSHAAEEAVSQVEKAANGAESSRSGVGPLHLVDDQQLDDEETAEEVLELTQPMDTAESVPASRPEFLSESSLRESMRRHEPITSSGVTIPTAAILSDDAASASRQSLAALSALLVKPDDENGDNTLEGLVREMLRPMMKEWLDQKLPTLVERLVEKEIARLTGRLG
jgi:cell pole-organizing protein PopZ